MVKQYVGARYVPKFASPLEWAADTSYEALTIVTFNNASYTSKIQVPPTVGNPANNPKYWALTGNYNAQVEQYRQVAESIGNNLTTEITNLKNADTTLQGQITTVSKDLTTEITNLKNADTTLQNNIAAEATARQTTNNILQGNINSEAATRASTDSNLQSQINQIVAPSGEAPSAAEVQNARIGADGVTYDTLGTAIRSQVKNSILATQEIINYLHSNKLKVEFLSNYWIDGNGVLKAYDKCQTAIFPVIKGNRYVYTYTVNDNSDFRQVVAFYNTKPHDGTHSYDEKSLINDRNQIFQAPITGYCAIYYSVKNVDIDAVGFKVSVVSDDLEKRVNKGNVLNDALANKIDVEHSRNTYLSVDTFSFLSKPTDSGESVVFPVVKNNYYVYSCNNNNYTRNRVAFFNDKPINGDVSSYHYNIDSGVPFVSPIDGYCVVYYYHANSTSNIDDEISVYSRTRNSTMPQYYNQYLADKEKTIMSKEEFSGIDGDEFVWITDYHYESNANNSPALIDHILRNTGASKIIFGGDAYNSANTNDNAFNNSETIENAKRKLNVFNSFWSDLCKDNFYYVVGNHEYNNPGSNEPNKQLSNNAVYSLCMRKNEDKIVTDGLNYYFDNKNKKIRYICVPCEYNTSVTSEATKAIEMINNVPDGWSVVVISHIGTNETKQTLNTLKNSVKPIADALKNNSTRINAIGIFCGHTHADALFKYNDINIISTTCDAYKKEFGDLSRNKNDISEQAFDIVNIDTKNRHVYLTRIGAGNDRDFTY